MVRLRLHYLLIYRNLDSNHDKTHQAFLFSPKLVSLTLHGDIPIAIHSSLQIDTTKSINNT